MTNVKTIFKVKEKPSVGMSTPVRQVAEEDYSVRKNINTLEGTIEKVPVNANDIVNKAYADSLGGSTGSIYSSDVICNSIGEQKYLDDFFNNVQSAGYLTGGDFTDNGDGTLAVGSGTGVIKSGEYGATSYCVDWSANNNISITSEITTYIYIDYNNGAPIIVASTTKPTSIRTNILLGKVYKNGGDVIHLFKAGNNISDIDARSQSRWIAQYGESVLTSGGIVAETGLRYLTVTSAVLYGGITKAIIDAIDTSDTGDFTYFYSDGLGGWTLIPSQTQVNNTQYNNDGTLTNLLPNKYRTDFIYLGNDGHLHLIMGDTTTSTLIEAQLIEAPSSVPSIINQFTSIIAKVIIKQGESNVIEIDNLITGATFSTSGVTQHNELSSLQGGTADEYYHLTSAEVAEISANTSFTTTPSTVITAGNNLSWDGNTLNTSSSTALFKASTGSFTDNDTSQIIVDSFCTSTSLVTVAIGDTEPAGTWKVDSYTGSFIITSDTAESTDIGFDYYITKV